MLYISHRGNISKKDPSKENSPDYIMQALSEGWDVEVDVWMIHGKFFLGHDEPTFYVDEDFLYQKNLWIHAKSINALNHLRFKSNCFFHNTDDAVLTSHLYLWTYPGMPLTPNSIAVLPETVRDIKMGSLKKAFGICSDIISQWKYKLSKDNESND